jgi:hypothetical protein
MLREALAITDTPSLELLHPTFMTVLHEFAGAKRILIAARFDISARWSQRHQLK